MDKKILAKALFILFSIMIGFAMGYFVKSKSLVDFDPTIEYMLREKGNYRFINPLLECEVANGTIDSQKQDFGKELKSFVQGKITDKKLLTMSVYFRDLNNGPSFGVNENDPFLPASLLKVPIMMAFFAEAENNPDLLKKEFVFEKEIDISPKVQFVKPSQEIKLGTVYTTEQLIEATIKHSDNQASLVLHNNIPINQFSKLYSLLGINDSSNTLSVLQYGRFFRILFNSSFLSHYYSEKSLELLSEADYKNAVVAGVPEGIVVSHKFGESGSQEKGLQLHDCGIVYYPNHPYLLCIMSKGNNLPNLENSIKEVSQFIYGKISGQY